MRDSQSGYILITGLIFILIISVVTIGTMQSTNLDYKISSNEVFKNVSFQGSESGRATAGDALSYFLYHRRWSGYNTVGMAYNSTYDPSADTLQDGEDIYQTQSLNVDFNFDVGGVSLETIETDISVMRSPGVKSGGSGLQQLSGYEGLGKGAGAGGIHLIYEIRSLGYGAAEAVTVTASEYRVVP